PSWASGGAAVTTGAALISAALAGAGGAAAPAGAAMTVDSRHSTNWLSSLVLTSARVPRPNWATRPVMARSVTTDTAVPSPSAVRVAVMVALALPCPRVSRPSARRTAVWLSTSRLWNVALPLYWAVIGPTLTFTTPRYSSPSTSWSWAPGRHGAMRSTSVSTAHASATGRPTRNVLVSSIARDPPGCRRPPVLLGTLPLSPGRVVRASARAHPRRPRREADPTRWRPGERGCAGDPRRWRRRSETHMRRRRPTTPPERRAADRPGPPPRHRGRVHAPSPRPFAATWPGRPPTPGWGRRRRRGGRGRRGRPRRSPRSRRRGRPPTPRPRPT